MAAVRCTLCKGMGSLWDGTQWVPCTAGCNDGWVQVP
jgi:hypothetical protein